ncbi:MAG: methyltransferase [Candidatus Hydrogenedentes bacterium]|nr:methyltransferase [Candidatus Hydrogenedentota bacterium]
MTATSRELVFQTLNRERPGRVPRQLWDLPWAEINHGAALAEIRSSFPDDFVNGPQCLREKPDTFGDPYVVGEYRDEWGCVFENLQNGHIGEVKEPLIKDWATDTGKVHIPREWLTVDRDGVNRFCAGTDKFVFGGCCPRPFERLQFLRGTVDLYMDLMAPPPEMLAYIKEIHTFYCAQMEVWAATDVDALNFIDDWGAQDRLLIDPVMWRDIFKPMYKDYIDIAHGAGKKVFMHSDGHILAIYPDLIELGLDAINSQLFCMGLDTLKKFVGKICFWGEIDRQHLLPEGDVADIERAVNDVYKNLWRGGGCIAQCEFGPGAKPENVRAVFSTWAGLVTG